MIGEKKIVCVIPARLRSTRFPKKILADLGGRPLIEWAWRGALRVPFFDEVLIAVDDEETVEVVRRFGGKWKMTSVDCPRGTDRLAEICAKGEIQGDIWVNWQADEPFLSVRAMRDLLQSCSIPGIDVWTLKMQMKEDENFSDPNICKVVCDARDRALYFSRSPIPYRTGSSKEPMYRHIGLYAYTSQALLAIGAMPSSGIEEAESLEQLRFLYRGMVIQVHETQEISFGIDVKEHLVQAEEYVQKCSLQGLLIENIPFVGV